MSQISDPIVSADLEVLRRLSEGSPLSGRRVLVTGGSGFIGSWLCDLFVAEGASVTCLDDMSTGILGNISHLRGQPRFKFIRANVASQSSQDLKCDLILHLASHPSPEEYGQHPVESLAANSQGTLNMLEIARANDATLLFTSSSEVYGDAQIVPTPESYWGNANPIGPRSCYDEGKRFGEALCMAYFRQYGVDVRLVRIFNSYGPRLRADGLYARALSRFIMQALSNSDLTVYGNGLQTRSFSYVTDTIRALLLTSVRRGLKAQVLNIGNPNEVSIRQLAETIIKLTSSSSKIVYQSRPVDDPQRRCPDISRAKALLTWTPHVDLEGGLSKTIKWFAAKTR